MKIIAFTGAGISKSAGIPAFEETPHLKEKLSAAFKKSNPQEFEETLNLLKANIKGKKPTKAHYVLAVFQVPVITMNIDGLHQKAGSRTVYELHGNAEKDNIVLYGQELLCAEDSIKLLIHTAIEASANNEIMVCLVIGTSMQTAFANNLIDFAEKLGMKIYNINQNADEETPKFFKEIYGFLPEDMPAEF